MSSARNRRYIGGYRVIASIGVGSSATVYRGLEEKTGRQVAIKVLADNHSLAPERRQRFLDEVELLAAIDSPSVATMYELGETESGQPFMVLELADRGDLRHRVEDVHSAEGRLGRGDLVVLAQHLAKSLSALHAAGIVHRDVSPSNVLICGGRDEASPPGVSILEPGERFLLADLGLAKDLDYASGITAGAGTRGFAAPEQRERISVVDHRADVFAATAVLEWAASGTGLVERLDTFLDIGLAVEPKDRFDSMEEWLAALRWSLGFPTRPPVVADDRRSPLGAIWARFDGVGVGLGGFAKALGAVAVLVVFGVAIATLLADSGSGPSEEVSAEGASSRALGGGDGADTQTSVGDGGSTTAAGSSSKTPGTTDEPMKGASGSSSASATASAVPSSSTPISAASSTGQGASSTVVGSTTLNTTPVSPQPTTTVAPTTTAAPTTVAPTITIDPGELAVPRAFLAAPSADATIAGDLAIQGVAAQSEGIASVELVIKNLETDRYWHDASSAFQANFVRFPVAVSPAGGSEVSWSYKVSDDALPPGRYLLRVWARGASGAGDPISDLRYVTVTD